MSNFQCLHCGMTNIDCGKEGYKTPREIELEEAASLCIQKQEVLNEIENHLTSFLNMQNSDVNEINTGFNAGAKTVARLVLNIIEKANNEQDYIL